MAETVTHEPPLLPQNVTRIEADEVFTFACHPGVSCFTECCRELELALTPYDCLRLKQATGLTSSELLDRYVIQEQDSGETFPRFYLTMVDDGRASCVFVGPQGCTIYPNRPAACRTYPMCRAASRLSDGGIDIFHVLIREAHCLGFAEQQEHTATSYDQDQGLEHYNRFNDALTAILQHEQVRQGRQFSPEEIELFTLSLYDLDRFRDKLLAGELSTPGPRKDHHSEHDPKEHTDLPPDDEALLFWGMNWLQSRLFKG